MTRTISNILVPTDFSDPSDAALNYGRELARTFGASLHVLHVLDEAEMRGVVGAGYIGPSPTLARREQLVEQAVRDRLDDLFDESDRRRLNAHVRAVTGGPVCEILRYTQEQKIDLVVMGTHGRTGIAHLILGSVAEHVLRKSPCPVLTVHGPHQELAA